MAYGDGVITPKGYRRIMRDGRYVMEHVAVWEREHQRPVPPGHDVHHVDGDKLNNRPDNLRLLTKLEHKRIHGGCELRDGVWWKPCTQCKVMKPLTTEHYYLNAAGSPNPSRCRPCHIAITVAARSARRAAARATRSAASA